MEKGLRIAQMIVCPIVQAQLKEVDDLNEILSIFVLVFTILVNFISSIMIPVLLFITASGVPPMLDAIDGILKKAASK